MGFGDRFVMGAGRVHARIRRPAAARARDSATSSGVDRIFVAGSGDLRGRVFLVGVAPNGWWLIAARAFQGVGAAVVAPASLSLLTASFPPGRERTRAVAWYGAAAGIGASLGLVIGGALADWVSWRAGFFINVPIGIAMIVLAPRFIPETKPSTGRFDVAGAVYATLGMAALVFGMVNSAEAGRGITDHLPDTDARCGSPGSADSQ